MAKSYRKRPRTDGTDDQQCQALLNASIKRVKRIAKKAKAFEIQRLVRKSRCHQTQPKVHAFDPGAQLEALKSTDHGFIARSALVVRLLRDPAWRTHHPSDAPLSKQLDRSLTGGEPQPQRTGEAAKADHRLASNKELARAVASEVERIVGSTCGSHAMAPKTPSARAAPASTSADAQRPRPNISADRPLTKPAETTKVVLADASRASENDSEDVGSGENGDDPTRDFSGSDEDVGEDEHSWPLHKKAKLAMRAMTTQSSKVASSSFMPSLAGGYTMGDSDASDFEDHEYERQERDRGRKNRRGQRARRAIWEKRYGKRAKHLQKQEGPKRSTTDKQNQSSPVAATYERDRPASGSSANREPVSVNHRPIHASWEAKMKERAAQPQGQKIVFV